MRRIIQRVASFLDRSPEFFREDIRLFELNRRFLWFVVFRFIVVLVFLTLALGRDLFLPYVAVSNEAFFAMAAFLFAANLVYWFHYKRAVLKTDLSRNVQVQIILDFAILGYLSYRCGGVESPLIYFFLFHNVISCLFFKKRISFIYTLISLIIIIFISVGPFFGVIQPHHFIYPDVAALFYNKITHAYQLSGIAAVYMIVWFFAANITDSLKRHEDGLQAKIEELIEMDREKTRVMLVTTHELKAPFSSIQSYVNVILGGYAGDISEKVREIMGKIRLRCETLMRMITEMIQLANISSLKEHKEEVVMKHLDMAGLIGKVAKGFAEAASSKGVRINLPVGGRYELEANPEQLDILFNNILSNAVNYCYPDTEIKIKIEDLEDVLLLSVADSGIGIKKEYQEKVFLEYFRTEKAALMNKNSTGLGLTISRQIMDIHYGRIWVESEEGVGTTVFMEFPKGV